MLKLNASYSKKVPAEGEYSSQSYHASIEVELPDGLSQEQLQGRIHETFELVRESVEAELGGKNSAEKRDFGGQNRSNNPTQRGTIVPASSKQIQYLLDLARGRGVTSQQIAQQFNVPTVNDLTKRQCSDLINSWKGVA